jgi:hypothetical protein
MRLRIRWRVRVTRLLWALASLLAAAAQGAESFRDGDIVFQTSRSAQSLAIQRATHSPYSHVGIIFLRGGKPYVFEAVATVRYTPLENWTVRGAGARFAVKRLRSGLTAGQVVKLRSSAARFAGKPYDLYFEWTNDRIYCSELIWKMYSQTLGIELGMLQKLREFDLADNEVKARMRERYGTHVPLDEPVISPAAIYDSHLLKTISD